MNQQTSTIRQSDNLLSLAKSLFWNDEQRVRQSEAPSSTDLLPPNRALYERVKRIADELAEEDSPFDPSI